MAQEELMVICLELQISNPNHWAEGKKKFILFSFPCLQIYADLNSTISNRKLMFSACLSAQQQGKAP